MNVLSSLPKAEKDTGSTTLLEKTNLHFFNTYEEAMGFIQYTVLIGGACRLGITKESFSVETFHEMIS